MKQASTTSIFLLLFALLLGNCQKAQTNFESSAPPSAPEYDGKAQKLSADSSSVAQDWFRSSLLDIGSVDSSKRLIRTAELRFRTSDAVQTTLKVEDIVRAHGGFVLNNELSSQIENQTTVRVSRDSLLETTHFVLNNQLTFRVPAGALDTTLRTIGKMADFLDYRRLHARDVALELLEQAQTMAREQQFQSDVATNKKSDPLQIAEGKKNSRAQTDQAQIERMKIEDAIKYSTVQLDVYQRGATQYRLLPLEKPVAAFRPGFWKQIGDALLEGWESLGWFLLSLLSNWGTLLLFAGATALIVRFWRRKKA